MPKVMLKLKKGEEIKYISHLDLIRSFEFALRRARIPVVYSAGFNPRPRMSFGSAVGVGVTSDDERIVLELEALRDPSETMHALNEKLPPGLQVVDAQAVEEGVKSPLSQLDSSVFRIEFDADARSLRKALDDVMAAREVPIDRDRGGKSRKMDIRPFVFEAHITDDSPLAVEVFLGSGSSGGAGPWDFVAALQDRLPALRVASVHRIAQGSHRRSAA